MKAGELRIGNLVYYDENLISTNVLLISENMSKYKGIPLTEEWLVKFGFEDYYKNYLLLKLSEHHEGGISININKGTCEVTVAEYGYHVPCKYVHQLQNLYFALTGEELTI